MIRCFHANLSHIRISALLLVILILGSGAFLLTPSIHGNDGVLNFVYLRSLVEDGDLEFSNDYREFDIEKNYDYRFEDLPRDVHTGRYTNRYGIGSSLLWAPFYLTNKVIYRFFNSSGRFNSYGVPAAFAISIGSLVYAGVGIVILFFMLRRLFSLEASWYAILFMLWASPLTFYIYFHPSMSHANSFFLITAWMALYLALDKNSSRRFAVYRWIGLGFLSALIIMTRYQDAIILPVIIAGELHYWITKEKREGNRRGMVAAYFLFFISFIIMFIPQLLTWKYLYGSYLSGPAPYLAYEGFNLLLPRHILQALFSPWHGLFYWHPFLIIGLFGLIALGIPGISRRLGIMRSNIFFIFLLLFILNLYLVGCWEVWHAGASFGQRLMITSLPALAVGISVVWTSFSGRVSKIIMGIILILAILWNANLIYKYGTHSIPRQERVTWTEMLF